MKRPNLKKAAEAGLVLGLLYGVATWLLGEEALDFFVLVISVWVLVLLLKIIGILLRLIYKELDR